MNNAALLYNISNADPKRRRMPRLAFAFTLIELLVVIGILGILSSLVLAGISKAKASAKTAQCKNNHRQCSLTALMFVGDNHRYLPTPWMDTLATYTPNLFPACVNIDGVNWYYNGWGSGGRFIDDSLGLVEPHPILWDLRPSMGLPETKVLSPSDMLMFLDCVAIASPPRMRNDTLLMFTNFPHNGAINVSYCDGHVDSLKQREIVAIPDNIKVTYNTDHLAHADTW